jgi:hypothetical protein
MILVGFPTFFDLWRSMITLVPSPNLSIVATGIEWLGYWEFNIYVGLTGAVFIVFFGIVRWFSYFSKILAFQKMVIPLWVIIFLSIGRIYLNTRVLRIPLLDGERAPSRMIGLALVLLILIAAIYFQSWLDEKRMPRALALGVSALIMALIGNDLWTHSKSWNLEAFRAVWGPAKVALSGSSVSNHFDKPYFALLLLGLLCSILTAVFLFLRVRHELRQTRTGSSV